MRAGRVTIRFSMNSNVERMPTTEIQTETGTMRVAAPEATAFDLFRYQAAAGHLSNIVTVLGLRRRNCARPGDCPGRA
jgi:hypothetical protein